MSKTSKVIYIDTITREFIKFAKIMGIFPRISYYYAKTVNPRIDFFKKKGFYMYVRENSLYYNILNDGLIKNIFLFEKRWHVYFDSETGLPIDGFEDINELADLFLSHLRDKGYPRYIKIIHNYDY